MPAKKSTGGRKQKKPGAKPGTPQAVAGSAAGGRKSKRKK